MNIISIVPMFFAVLFWVSVVGILYSYFGYPFLIFIVARFRSIDDVYHHQSYLPHVTLLIAAYNEEAVIEDKIKNCLAIDYPKDQFQILIVADGSSDRTSELVEKYSEDKIELLYQPERGGKMAAINRAIPFCRGDILVFSDANNFYQPDTIKKLVAPFGNPEVGAVSGAKSIEQGDGSLGASEGLYWKYESFIKKQESRAGSCTSAAGEILAIRKKLYASPPGNIINDDFYIAMQVIRQGFRFVYAADAKSTERVSLTAQDEITRRTRINAGRYQAIALARQILPFQYPMIVWQIISHKFLRPIVPFAMIVAAISNLALILIPAKAGNLFLLGAPYNIIIFGLQVLFYLMALIGSQIIKKGDKNILARVLYIPTFLINSNYAALKGFYQYQYGHSSHVWERIQRR